jgi:hypothetical protein
MNSNSEGSPNTSRNTSSSQRTHTISALEKKADALLEEAFPSGLTIPVDIDLLAEAHLHLEIVPIPGLKDTHEVLGLLWKRANGEHKLVVDEDVLDYQPALYRFTLGEEIAHYVLHRQHFKEVETLEQASQAQRDLQADLHHMERNAKWFAAALLMPCRQVRQEAARIYELMVSHVGYADIPAVLKKLSGVLAQRFRVSAQAMNYRLDNHPCKVTEALRAAMARNQPRLWEVAP